MGVGQGAPILIEFFIGNSSSINAFSQYKFLGLLFHALFWLHKYIIRPSISNEIPFFFSSKILNTNRTVSLVWKRASYEIYSELSKVPWRSTLLTQTHSWQTHSTNNFDEKAKNRKLLTFVFFGLSTNISITKQNEIYYDVRNIYIYAKWTLYCLATNS